MLARARRQSILGLLLLLIVVGCGLGGPQARAGSGGSGRLTLLFDTHFHGFLNGPNDVTFAEYAGLVQARRAAVGNALFLGAGDDLGGSQMSAVFFGAQMVDAFNAAGLDVDTFGNHEFDYGPENVLTQVRASRFSWVSANVRDRRTGGVFGEEAGVRPFVFRDVAGIRVGITGAAWQFVSSTSGGPSLEVVDAATALQTVVPQMRAAGAQVVIVLSHMGHEEAEAVAAKVNGIDVILGDHEAQRIPQPRIINGAIVARRGDEYQSLGELTLTLEDGRIAGHSYRDYEITKDLPTSGAVAAVIAGYQARLDQELLTPLGSTATPLDARTSTVRSKESNLGDLIADALRAWGKADVAIMNGGGIRGNKEYPAGTLTRGDIVSILPFNNTAELLRVSGADLRAALENGVSQTPAAGRFPQVSGLSFHFDAEAEPGSRVLTVMVNNAPLDPAASYTLATNNFVADGGDGYEMFKNAEVLIQGQAGPLLTDLLVDAVQRAGVIGPHEEGRIQTGR